MANAYTQEIILDADGKPVVDALTQVRAFMADIQKIVAGIGVTAEKDAKAWATALSSNLKQLKQAESDIRALQSDRSNRRQGFEQAERGARQLAQTEVRADKEANSQKLIQAKVTYREKEQVARAEANVEKQLAKEVAEFERTQDRAAIASAKEVAAARREAATAAVTAKARGITNRDDAIAAKTASDMRLQLLRRERETTAANDADGARGIANRIAVEKALGAALDGTIRKLDQQAAAERRAQDAATRRLQAQLPQSQRLLAPGNVRDEVIRSGDPKSTLVGYQLEQELARQNLLSAMQNKNLTLEQVTAAREKLQLANANVDAAKKLVQEDEKLVQLEQRLAAAQRQEQMKAQVALSGQYAREQIAALGPKEALRRATEATAAAEQKLAAASGEHIVFARQELALAEAQQKAIKQQGQGGPLSNILSPGYAATAFARTSIYGAAAGAAYGVFGAVQGGASQVVEMEDELQKLQAIANATDPQLQQLKASIYAVGESSRFSVIDLAKVSQTLAQAGVSAGEMEKVLSAVTTLATASGSTPDEAVNLVTSALGSFQLQSSEAARVADLMTSALNRTKLTVQQTGQAIQYVGATAFEQNISLEQLLGTVGAIAQAGVKSGSTIGTGFRQFLVDLQTPSEKLKTQLDAVGLSASEVNVAVRGLPAVLKSLGDAGFGSSQAYQGLETRAAAFYLVAKNNIPVMDELQMSFAQQGAAAIANERAMNSLSAQWQRFKNVLSEGFGESLETPLIVLQNIITAITDKIKEGRDAADEVRKLNAEGKAGIMNYDLTPAAEETLKRTLNMLSSPTGFTSLGTAGGGLGDWLESWTTKANGATAASERMATRSAEATEKVEGQSGKISELDKEMERLVTQQDSLKDGSNQVNVETVSLTARFEGLAAFLTTTKDKYGDLMNAMREYRAEAVRTQASYLNSQIAELGEQERTSKGMATQYANAALRDPKFANDARLLEALRAPRVRGAGQVIADASVKYGDQNLTRLSSELFKLTDAVSRSNLARSSRADMIAQNTGAGQSLQQRTVEVEGRLRQFTSLDQPQQVQQAPTIRNAANAVVAEVKARLANPATAKDAVPRLNGYLARAGAVVKGIDAALAPTKAETAEAKRRDREAKAAGRAADREAKLVTQADVDRIGQALGLKLGSGTRTPAQQEALHAAGATPARGFGPRTSNHVSGTARDFSVSGMSDAEARRTAATMRAQYRAAGIDAQVLFEDGKTAGTGRHIHVGVRKGTNRRTDQSAGLEDRNQATLARDQLGLDEDNLKTQLKAVSEATTTGAFDTAVAAAKAALDKVNAQLEPAALDELAAAGIAPGSPQFELKMRQVRQEIAQNTADFQQKITDGIIKSTKKQLEAADTAFDAAIAPAQGRLAIAQAQSSGLDAYSLRNKVPDYVKNLANDRIAMNQEAVTRAQYAAAPARIDAQQQAMDALRGTIGRDGVDPVQVNAQLATMNVELTQLIANRDALAAQLGAGGLVPTTLADGLNQAIESYRNANNLGRSFKDDIIMNLGGAIETVNTGLETMFTNIANGSQTALQAFGSFAKGMISYIQQMLAKILAAKALEFLLNLVGTAIGSKVAGGNTLASGGVTTGVNASGNVNVGGGISVVPFTSFNGGPAGAPIKRLGGGSVENGSTAADSVHTKLARGEWVVKKEAVDSVGNQFMARLNQHGSKALDSLQSVPKLDMRNHTETNVWVVPQGQQPQMGPNDVRIILNDELLNGDGKRLVQNISREG
jgi:TP901 family phage tail tape measure protein